MSSLNGEASPLGTNKREVPSAMRDIASYQVLQILLLVDLLEGCKLVANCTKRKVHEVVCKAGINLCNICTIAIFRPRAWLCGGTSTRVFISFASTKAMSAEADVEEGKDDGSVITSSHGKQVFTDYSITGCQGSKI